MDTTTKEKILAAIAAGEGLTAAIDMEETSVLGVGTTRAEAFAAARAAGATGPMVDVDIDGPAAKAFLDGIDAIAPFNLVTCTLALLRYPPRVVIAR